MTTCSTKNELSDETYIKKVFKSSKLVPEGRAGADDAHFACEDVPQLGNFIQGGLAQNAADTGDVLLRIGEHVGRHIMRCGHLHAAEFVITMSGDWHRIVNASLIL